MYLILSGRWKSSEIKKRRVKDDLLPPYVLLQYMGQRFNSTLKHYQQKGSDIRRYHEEKGSPHECTLPGRLAKHKGIAFSGLFCSCDGDQSCGRLAVQ